MKTRTLSLVTTALVAAGMACTSLQADTLALYDFSANTSPTSSVSGLTASVVALGSFNGVTASGNYGRSTASGGNLFSRAEDFAGSTPNFILNTTEEAAVAGNTYFEFTFTPGASQSFNYTAFSVDIGSQTISGSATPLPAYTGHFFVRSSMDGFTANLGTDSFFTASEISGTHGPSQTFTSNLGSGFSSVSGTVTFRIYAYIETTSRDALQSLRLDNVTLTGTSAIPEPANAGALLGAVMILTALVTRRRARR